MSPYDRLIKTTREYVKEWDKWKASGQKATATLQAMREALKDAEGDTTLSVVPIFSNGYAYKKPDGTYLHVGTTYTHTGLHQNMVWVENLSMATVFYTLPSPAVRQAAIGAERIPVTETRHVFARAISCNEWEG
jgi:hypothetical protein